MAAVSLFWDTNMAAMISCENTCISYNKILIVIISAVPVSPKDSINCFKGIKRLVGSIMCGVMNKMLLTK